MVVYASRFARRSNPTAVGIGLGWWRGCEACFCFVLVDEAVFHADDAFGVLGDGFIVGDDDDGFTSFVELNEDLHDFLFCFRVEVTGGFIC